MIFENWLALITAISSLIAALSVFAGFWIYKVSKRDDYIAKVRTSLQHIWNSYQELDRIINYEIAYEFINQTFRDEKLSGILQSIFDRFIIPLSNKEEPPSAQVIENMKVEYGKRSKKIWGIIAFSLNTSISSTYNKILSEDSEYCTVFLPDFTGLYRFYSSCNLLFRGILDTYKHMLNQEKLWIEVTSNSMKQLLEGSESKSITNFKGIIFEHWLSILDGARIKHHQKDIDRIIRLSDLVYEAYIELKPAFFHAKGRHDRKVQMKPIGETDKITDDLREAEKCFRNVFTHDQGLEYISLIQAIESNNSPNDNDGK